MRLKIKTLHRFLRCLFLLNCLLVSQPEAATTMLSDSELRQQLELEFAAKGADYSPRTRHKIEKLPKYINRLIREDSPYLLQHAHNPVNWYAWGKEAFAAAKQSNKPIFLSIGYATCHWCHVMEEESFENEQIAAILNQHFISIKVDREQHPDIDETYMTAVMLMTGQGGWPMSSFLLPDGRPFFAGTYFQPSSFAELLTRIEELWRTENDKIVAQATQLSNAVIESGQAKDQVSQIATHAAASAADDLLSRYDETYGGFGTAPKFPSEPSLTLLLQMGLRDQKNQPLHSALNHTLTVMASGGVYDQIGGGFHRYATDDKWLVPHFEKMLYNQAYLARIYIQASRQYQNSLYARTGRQILDYVLREMTRDDGGFYSATDADSEGEEGLFFVWTPEQIDAALDPTDADWIKQFYDFSPSGNFEGKTIFALPRPLDDLAKKRGESVKDLITTLDRIHKCLWETRSKRIPPLTDDKIIVSWNGMMITALAEAATALNEPRYLTAAINAAELIWQKQRTSEGELIRVNLDQKASITAKQDDYAHYAEALLSLYDQTSDPLWLDRAKSITDVMINLFLDAASGRFLLSRDSLLFSNSSSNHDGATPSSNAVAVRALGRLWRRSGEHKYAELANQVISAFAGEINQYPGSYAYMLAQLDEINHGETDSTNYLARGAIRVVSSREESADKTQISLTISIRDGWHINAHNPNHPELIGTQIRLLTIKESTASHITYPTAQNKQLDFESQPLALYENEVVIHARIDQRIEGPLELALDMQACNNTTCLPPETVRVFVMPFVDPA